MTLEPAFPRSYVADGHNGMSLRDWFAGHADLGACELSEGDLLTLLGEAEYPKDLEGKLILAARFAAKLRYMFADAMIAEQEKVGGA